jgi:hypothetical protein
MMLAMGVIHIVSTLHADRRCTMPAPNNILTPLPVAPAAWQPQQWQLGRRDRLVTRVLTAEAQSLDVTKVQRQGTPSRQGTGDAAVAPAVYR